MPPDAFVEIVTGSARSGARFDCRVLRQVERPLMARDAAAGEQFAGLIEDQC